MKYKRTKKSIIEVVFFIALFSFSVPASLCKERTLSVKLGVSYFQPSEKATKDIYGGKAVIRGEVNLKVWKFIDLWLAGSHYTKRGNLPFTKEATRLILTPVGGGVKIVFKNGIINPYVGIGPVMYFYRERNPIGLAKGTKVGIIGQAGCYLKVIGGLLFDICIDYSYCVVKPQRIKSNIGGIKAGIGLGFEF